MQKSDLSDVPKRRYFELAQSILLSITNGQLAAGDRLPPDREIATQHGVSRATAREALLALELVGAVEIQHGNGVYVRGANGSGDGSNSFLGSEVLPRELMEARQQIEPVTIAMAALKISPTTIKTVRAEIAEAQALVEDMSQLDRFVEISFRFHSTLALECGNRLMSGIVSDLVNTEVHPLWTLINQQVNRTAAARKLQLHEHTAILDALESGNAERAKIEMQTHLNSMARSLFI